MIIIGFVLGTVLGSFVKALADRSLTKQTFRGRSRCPNCQHKLGWCDLLPIFSYIYLLGKCRYCKKKISVEYLLVEVVMGILVGLLFWQEFKNFQFSIFNFQLIFNVQNFQLIIVLLEFILKIFFIIILGALFLTDIKKMFIPDRVILPSIIIGIIVNLIISIFKIAYLYYFLTLSPIGRKLLPPYTDYFQRHAVMTLEPFFWSLITGALIAGFFFSLIIITRGKGMGGGDVKLGAFMGIMLGFPNAVAALFIAFLTGAVFSIGLIIFGKKHFGQTIPFGPFLVLGSLIILFWGSQIIDWYLHLK